MHVSPLVLVPRPGFQSLRAPFGAHHPRTVAEAFAPAGPLCAFVLDTWANHSASDRRPRVFDRSAGQRTFERSAAPMGFLLHPEDVLAPSGAPLRKAPSCPSKPRVFGV